MEYLDIIDIETDTVIGNAPKTDIYQKKLPHRIVHIIVYRGNGKIVLQKRSHLVKKYPHMWATGACGHVSSGESYKIAAENELLEELGVHSKLEFINTFLYSSELGMMKSISVYKTICDQDFILEDKISEAREFSSKEIREIPRDSIHPELLYLIDHNYL